MIDQYVILNIYITQEFNELSDVAVTKFLPFFFF